MSIFVPNYYRKFKCTADKCRHNCCIGWEIDIDGDTLEYYKSLKSSLGEKITDSISFDGNPHFVLCGGERCPHLNQNNLCDIICGLGEGALCQICAEHPRFYNCFDSFTEGGLGLCCEEAARIIMGENEKFAVIPQDGEAVNITKEEEKFLNQRHRIFDILCDASISIKARFTRLCEIYNFSLSSASLDEITKLYKRLERLDTAWTDILCRIEGNKCSLEILDNNDYARYFENLACYLIYRHLSEAFYDGSFPQRVMFILSACLLLASVFEVHLKEKGVLSFEDICEYARMFSSEVEYSEENTELIFDNICSAFTV